MTRHHKKKSVNMTHGIKNNLVFIMKDIFIFQEKKRLLLNEWYLTTKHDVQSLYKNMSDLLAIAQLVL